MRIATGAVALLCAAVFLSQAAMAVSLGRSAASGKTDSADSLVQRALLAEVAGDNDQRNGLIQRALTASDDCAAAHWQAGHVRVGAKWLTLPVAREHAGDERTSGAGALVPATGSGGSGEFPLVPRASDRTAPGGSPGWVGRRLAPGELAPATRNEAAGKRGSPRSRIAKEVD